MIILSIFLDIRTRIHFMKCSVVIVVLGFIRVLFRNKHDWSSLSLLSSLWTCCCYYSPQFSLFFSSPITVHFRIINEVQMHFLTPSIVSEKAHPANVKKLSFHNAVRRTTAMSYYSWDREKKPKNERFIT
jgi:hypothetical protein